MPCCFSPQDELSSRRVERLREDVAACQDELGRAQTELLQQERLAQRTLITSVPEVKDQHISPAFRSSAELLVQIRQRQQLLDQLPAWLNKLSVNCRFVLSNHKQLCSEHQQIVATVFFAAARCQDVECLQLVSDDLQEKFGGCFVGRIANCNPNTPDRRLRVDDNVLRVFSEEHRDYLFAHAVAQAEQEWEEQKRVAHALAQHGLHHPDNKEQEKSKADTPNGHGPDDAAHKQQQPQDMKNSPPPHLPVEVTTSPYHRRMR